MKLFIAIILSAVTAAADVVYSNITNDAGFVDLFTINGIVEAGDQIQLNGIGPSWVLSSALASLYNNSANSGTADVTLNIYSYSGLTLGSLLATSTLQNTSFDANSATPLAFSGLSGAAGRDLAWTLQITSGGAGLDLGLQIFNPALIGSTDANYALWNTGSGLAQYSSGFGQDDYYFRLDATPTGVSAVPEPGTGMLIQLSIGLAAVGIGIQRRRKRS